MKEQKKKVPDLRFKGFTDDWEQRKLLETQTTFTDGNYSSLYPQKEDFTTAQNGVPFLTGSDIYDGKLNNKNCKYITHEKNKKLTSGHVAFDDVVIAVRGSLGNIGYASKNNEGWNINSQLAIIRTNKDELNGYFIFCYLITNEGFRAINSRITGTALKQLPIKQLSSIHIPVIDLKEQNLISKIFKLITNQITLQQRKLDLLKQLKKGLLQKMFADKDSKRPILRFNGFTDDWEQRKLGDIALFSKGKGISKKDLHTHGIYNIVHYADIYKFMPVQDKVLHHSNNKMGVRIGSNSLLFAGSDVTPKGLARTTAIKQENVRVGGDVIIADLSEKHLNYFMSYEINMNKRFIYPFITGSTVRHIHGSDLSHLNITFPSLSEQKNIAHIFNLIEHELSLLKIKKSKYQSIKKSLLQQMFI